MKKDKEFFDNQFINYNSVYGNAWGMNWRVYMKLRTCASLDETLKYIAAHDYAKILEIGCASGDFTNNYIEATGPGHQIIGSDISELAVNICKKRFEKYKNASFLNIALPAIGMKNVACIICMDVLEYFDERGKKECLVAMKDALSDNGILICQLPLDKEDEEAFLNLFSEIFQVEVKRYVYGKIWYKYFDQWLVLLVNAFLLGKRWGIIGKIIGKIAYKICCSEKIVSFWFNINEKFFPQKRSHMVLVGRK